MNLGHPATGLLVKILQDAKAPKVLIDFAKELKCDVCERLKKVRPARPTKSYTARKVGETLGLDISLFKAPSRSKKSLLLHMIDEASKQHIARVIKEGDFDESADKTSSGNITVGELLPELKTWMRFYGAPKIIHCDSEGVFNSQVFLEWCNSKSIGVITCAGEAHWQLGIVERHIATLSDQIAKMVLDSPHETSTQSLVDRATETKNYFGRYGGHSPSEWFLGRTSVRREQSSSTSQYRR